MIKTDIEKPDFCDSTIRKHTELTTMEVKKNKPTGNEYVKVAVSDRNGDTHKLSFSYKEDHDAFKETDHSTDLKASSNYSIKKSIYVRMLAYQAMEFNGFPVTGSPYPEDLKESL